MDKVKSPAQRLRQRNRDEDTGHYIKNPCRGCGRGAPLDDYWSWHMTDTMDSEGKGCGDAGLVMCKRCAKKTDSINTLREFEAFQIANGVKPYTYLGNDT